MLWRVHPMTHCNIIGSKVRIDIQSRVNFRWTKQKGFPQIMSWLKSQFRWPYSMQSRFWMDKIKGLSPNNVFVQKSRWPYSMQSKFGMDKIQGSYKLESGYIFTSPKKITDYLYVFKVI